MWANKVVWKYSYEHRDANLVALDFIEISLSLGWVAIKSIEHTTNKTVPWVTCHCHLYSGLALVISFFALQVKAKQSSLLMHSMINSVNKYKILFWRCETLSQYLLLTTDKEQKRSDFAKVWGILEAGVWFQLTAEKKRRGFHLFNLKCMWSGMTRFRGLIVRGVCTHIFQLYWEWW